jgi:GT2 family glycosyltransferase
MTTGANGLTSVVVVAADSGPLLRECVSAVLASSAPVEVVLVDNDSRDGEPQKTLDAHRDDPRVRSVRNATNLGFGRACNLGAARARGDALLFLNPDGLVEADTIRKFREAAADRANACLLGADVRDPDGNPARGSRRRDPTLRRALMSMSGLARWQERWPALEGIEMSPRVPDDVRTEPVEAVSGACMYLPRALFERVGGFDEGYFLHCEDLDLCRRVRDAGALVAVVHSARVRHVQGSSSRHRPVFVSRHKHRGMWRWFVRHDPAARNPLLRLLVGVAIGAHFLATAPYLWLRARVRG